MPTPRSLTTCPPADLAGWATLFEVETLPVMAETAAALETLRCNEDQVDAHLIAEAVASDPLMTLKVLAHVAKVRAGREGSDTETVTAALVMLGITPFFRAFGPQETVQEQLAATPGAMDGFTRVLERSRRAARFSMGFAVHRMDTDAAVLHDAALLHDFAELLLWLHAPSLATEMQGRLADDPALRSAQAQSEVLNVELADLEQVLMQQWRLPTLLAQITDDRATRVSTQMRNVRLAIRLARHTAQGWNNAALPDDLQEIADLLNLSTEAADRLVREIDTD